MKEKIEAVGATLCFLPLYSPDLKLIEKAFFRLKAILRKASHRTVRRFRDLSDSLVEIFHPDQSAYESRSCGFDPD